MAMLQLRPTFSESWYRVAGLKAKLRPSAQISRQFYRGDRWYVVRDPAGNQFHRLSDAAYRFVALLDGRRTVQEAWDLCGGQLADDAPTQPEVIHILSQLHAANLLEADITPDSAVLLKRYKQMQKRQWQGRMMNILFPRIPLWDPDSFLNRWMPIMRLLLSPFGVILWLALVMSAIFYLVPEWGRLRASVEHSMDPGNWIYLWAVFVLIKLVHELGHAFMCRRFGGEVHELGVMFLVLIPAPYVDASTAWSFRSRWQRMLVGGAGMIFELFIAAIAAFVWLNTAPGELVNQLAYNTMFIASVTTIVFNINPLLRYDGYYMLSDFWEIPNLRQKSTEYALGLLKRHVFRVKSPMPLPPPMQRLWLFLYAVASSIYRVFIGIMIIVVVAYRVPILGALMALGGVVTWLVVPVFKTARYLAIEPELHRKRGRATVFTAVVAAAIVVLVGLVPFASHIDSQGIVEPGVKDVVKVAEEGTVVAIKVHDGDHVKAGQVLVVMEDKPLAAQLEESKAHLNVLEKSKQQAVVSNQNDRIMFDSQIEAIQTELAEYRRRLEKLTVRATMDGEVIAPLLNEKLGMYLPRGSEIATLAQTNTVLVRANIDQRDYEWVLKSRRKQALIWLVSQWDQTLYGQDVLFLPASNPELVHRSLGFGGGGVNEVDPRDQSGKRAKTPQFEMQIRLNNDGGGVLPGQRAFVRCSLDKEPLAMQWATRFWQLLQSQGDPQWLKQAGAVR